jgi:hypothetical protein
MRSKCLLPILMCISADPEDARVSQHSAGDADQLALADREVHRALQYRGRVALRQCGDELMRIG